MPTPENSTIETDLGLDDEEITSSSDNPDFVISPEDLRDLHCKKLGDAALGLDPVDAAIDPADRQIDPEVMCFRQQFWALVGKDDPRIN